MIRRPVYQLLTAEYEVFEEEKSDKRIGLATVCDGVIERLASDEKADSSFTGQILSVLLTNIITEADLINSNLSIRLLDDHPVRMKRFLERFGFREIANNVLKRTAGALRPPGAIL